MKVLMLNTLFYPDKIGGAEKSVQILSEGLVKKGVDVYVICISREPRKNKNLNGINIRYITNETLKWPYDSSGNTIQKLMWHIHENIVDNRKVLSEINNIKPDILHTHNLRMLSYRIWSEANSLGIPVIHTFRDYSLICVNGKRFKKGLNCGNTCITCLISQKLKSLDFDKVSKFIGISNYISELHQKEFGLPKEKLVTIHNPIDRKDLSETSGNRILLNAKKLRVGYLGRLESYKGIEYLISELKGIDSDLVKLVIAGETNEKNKEYLYKLLHQLDYEYLGYIDKKKFFDKIDVLVVPSLWNEPFGRVLIESYSYGVPVIATKSGGIKELVTKKTGILFNSEIGELKRVIEDVFLNNNVSFDPKTLKEQAQKFTVENIVEKHMKLYQDVINEVK